MWGQNKAKVAHWYKRRRTRPGGPIDLASLERGIRGDDYLLVDSSLVGIQETVLWVGDS